MPPGAEVLLRALAGQRLQRCGDPVVPNLPVNGDGIGVPGVPKTDFAAPGEDDPWRLMPLVGSCR